MKKQLLLAASALCLSALCCACGDDNDDNSVGGSCSSSYTAQCNSELTAVLYCANGSIHEEICINACDPALNKCSNKPQCDSSFVRKCLDDLSGFQYCEAGKIKETTCSAGCDTETGMCKGKECKIAESCTDSTHTWCEYGDVKTETCEFGCNASGKCNECDDATYKAECTNPRELTTCSNGKLVKTECSGGQICNDSLKVKACRTPNVSDKCNASTFAEICYGTTEARYCDDATGTVKSLDCVKKYKDGYKCDIAENFYGPGRDVTMCYSREEACDKIGDVSRECTYEDREDGFRQYISKKYLCAEFNSGLHYYLAAEEKCTGTANCKTDDGSCNE